MSIRLEGSTCAAFWVPLDFRVRGLGGQLLGSFARDAKRVEGIERVDRLSGSNLDRIRFLDDDINKPKNLSSLRLSFRPRNIIISIMFQKT